MSKWNELKALAEDYLHVIDSPDEEAWDDARNAFEDAANADAILDLIAENERLRDFLSHISKTSGDKGAAMGARQLLKEFGE